MITNKPHITITDNWFCRECLHVFNAPASHKNSSFAELLCKTKCPRWGSKDFIINADVQKAIAAGKKGHQLLEVEKEFFRKYPRLAKLR